MSVAHTIYVPGPSSSSSPSRAPKSGERYVVRSEIGRGGCAVVYEAYDRRLARLVALKVVRKDARDAHAGTRLAREARAAAAIHHPNVCGLLDAGHLADRRPYLVMERLHGETLTNCLRRLRQLSIADAVDIALQLLAALGAAHAAGIVHRDVKPDNVFLLPRIGCGPLVKLLDFGMCRRVNKTVRDDATLTRAGQVVGTPEYMAPEQVSGQREFGARIDVWAVGVILYEALSGQRAFPGKDAREIVLSVLVKNLPPLASVRPDVLPSLERVVSRALEREASSRYASAAEFRDDLLELTTRYDRRPAPPQTGRRLIDNDNTDESAAWDAPTRHVPKRTA